VRRGKVSRREGRRSGLGGLKTDRQSPGPGKGLTVLHLRGEKLKRGRKVPLTNLLAESRSSDCVGWNGGKK